MTALVKQFWIEDDGLELLEYAVMTALMVATIVVAIGTFASAIIAKFTTTAAEI